MSINLTRVLLPSAVIATSLLLAACQKEPEVQAQQEPPPTPVTIVTITSEPVILERELSGRVSASEVAEVRPQVTGIVEKLAFTEGGSVEAGQVLYQIDQTAFRADLNSAQASLARARATLESAQLEAARSAELVKINAVSRQNDETAQAALRQAQADVRAAQAAVQSANVPLGFTRITAPISGRISRSSVTQGALVTAAQATPLATIQRMDPMYVQVSQSSAELLQLRRELDSGQLRGTESVPVEIVLEDGSLLSQPGQLSFAEATVDESTGSVMLRVVVPNPDQLLLPGMYVRARLANGERQNAILAPQQSIARDAKGNASAMVVDAEDRIEPRPVTVSRAIGDKWLVESGLAPGDRVVVAGFQKIRPGSKVIPAEAGSQPAPAADTPDAPEATEAQTDAAR